MLKQSILLPTVEKRVNAINEIRSTFRKFKNETNQEIIQQQLKKAHDKFGYLCMITPKRLHTETSQIDGKTQLVKIDGEWKDVNAIGEDDNLTKEEKATWSNWGRGNLDPDQVRKHEQLLKRQHFMDGPMKGYKPIYERNWMND
ncbi:predicted protein [Naegleria gruberi]|uniref:Predicted protein n=1 Tax=Naegleria gruberi TaxID=5762 RepID=D2VL56_NAEGR|nr:uncharacterized protein NAEGRDRAFT_50467 [Naegleria gruberi]EFC42483.1 predicted protein [Naegleria gruberi]|eukprot:XP_002675227.1 predicted protein [Naegleria gruberi strain NEG-M]